MAYCSKCKRDFPENMKFCHECGSPLEIKESEEKSENVESASVSAEVKRTKTNLGAQKTVLFLSLVTVVVAFAMIVGVLLIAGIAAEKPNYSLYVRDGELVYVGVSNRDSIVLSDGLTNYDVESLGGEFITVSRDRQYIIYPGTQASYGGYSLYVKSLRESDKTDVKISSSALRYVPSDDGTSIVYLESDGDLYRYDIKDEDKSKISTDVKDFAVSENFKKVLYITESGKLCVDGDTFAEDAQQIEYYSSDFSLFAYSKDKELYAVINFGEAKRLTDNMEGIFPSYEEGLLDNYKAYDGFFFYSVPSDSDPSARSLYYFDSEKNTLITDKGYGAYFAPESPYMIIKEKNGEEYGFLSAYGAETYPIELENADRISLFTFSSDGRTLYYFEHYETARYEGDLWKAEVTKNGEIRSQKKIDSKVDSIPMTYILNDSIIYYKNFSNVGRGDLYIDGKLIDYEATVACIDPDENSVYYYTNKDTISGTLKVYRNGRSEKISENVYDFDVSFGGEVFYLTNYDTLRDEGDLYLYRNEKSILIESGVSALVKVYNRE